MPGFTETSAFPKLWAMSGVPFPELCDRLLDYALARFSAERGAHIF
jgi:D-alanine-D-alanine ligase